MILYSVILTDDLRKQTHEGSGYWCLLIRQSQIHKLLPRLCQKAWQTTPWTPANHGFESTFSGKWGSRTDFTVPPDGERPHHHWRQVQSRLCLHGCAWEGDLWLCGSPCQTVFGLLVDHWVVPADVVPSDPSCQSYSTLQLQHPTWREHNIHFKTFIQLSSKPAAWKVSGNDWRPPPAQNPGLPRKEGPTLNRCVNTKQQTHTESVVGGRRDPTCELSFPFTSTIHRKWVWAAYELASYC